MTDSSLAYFDSSALVKLAVDEAESRALRLYVDVNPRYTTSEIAVVEVLRNVSKQGAAAALRARGLLDLMEFVLVDRALLERAAALRPLTLRSLDAIHLASALQLGAQLEAVVTYDARMQDAARSLGIAVAAPA